MILPSPLFKMGPDLLPVDYNVPPALKPEPGGRRWPVAVPPPRRRAEADAELARRARTTLNRLPWSAEIEAEDARRQRAVEARCALFDPFIGRFPEGAPERRVDVDAGFVRSRCPKLGYADTLEQALDGVASCPVAIPESMANDPALARVGSRREWQLLRFRHDFAYWAATCVSIKDKCRGRRVRFVLNYAQRRLLAAFERQRLAGRPIRTILLKARQWGGSTMTQMYMMWIQSVLTTDWNSLICTQVSHISAGIRGMLSQTLAEYPQELWLDECGDDDEEDAGGAEVPSRSKSRKKKKRKLCLAPYEGQREVRTIPGRRCNVTTASARNQDAVRGADYAMAHLSEVAFWDDTPTSSPDDAVRAIAGAIAMAPLTMVVVESTANGMGNYFQREWDRAERGDSDKTPLFVPWHEIDIYSSEPDDRRALWESLSTYELELWQIHGCSLAQIQWYRSKRREMESDDKMFAEYPTTASEAFINTGSAVFAPAHVEALRMDCCEPAARGEIVSACGSPTGPDSLRGLSFREDSTGCLSLWSDRVRGASYVAAVDVGGRSRTSDWSVIAVVRTDGEMPEVVAQWRGHTDHDLLTWAAARIAAYYNRALLVFESNTLESADRPGSDAPEQGAYILHTLYDHYPNLYMRQSPNGSGPARPGFHTNRQTKQMIITELIAAVRDGSYVERDHHTADEMNVYQLMPNGSYCARRGYHDDCIMTRAIALHVARSEQARPFSLSQNPELARFIGAQLGRIKAH